jgi:formylglycine-generating enzyme required for sulfatase activity/tRNA A-37 threonylcarbamoyl transferase component Bud32
VGSPSDLSGETLKDRYRIGDPLGSGGMGVVYRAHDVVLDTDVVVKVPHAKFLEDDEFQARFEREVKSLTRLEHPHVVRVIDAGSVTRTTRAGEAKVPYAVLQCLAGGSLKDRVTDAGGRLDPTSVASWLPDVAKALDFIHGQGVVHRDVKPGNILFDRSGHVFLADFGIAKALGSLDTGLTHTGMTPGSPDFMAPEAGTGASVGPAYDQYALAVVVFHVLSGQLPHTATNPMVLIVKKASEDPAPLGPLAPNVPTPAVAAVMRALSRDPAQRFATCAEFAEAFAAGLAPAAATSAPPVRVETRRAVPAVNVRRAPARPRNSRPLVVGSLLLLAGGGAFLMSRPRGPSDGGGARGGGVESAVALSVSIDSPADGALLASRALRVTGRVKGPSATTIKVNGAVAVRTGDQFDATILAPSDGATDIEAVASSRGLSDASASLRVDVDSTPPKLLLVKPLFTDVTLEPADVALTIEGQVTEAHLADVRVDAQPVVGIRPNGGFDAIVPLAEGEEKLISVVATDKAGHRDQVAIHARRKKAPPPAPPPTPPPPPSFTGDLAEAEILHHDLADLAEATSKALSDDMPAATSAWDRAVAKGATDEDAPAGLLPRIAKWKAPPDLSLAEPGDGVRVTANPVRIRGELRAGRATDEVVVTGVVVRTGPGTFETSVSLAQAGANRINVSVRDGGVARGSAVERRVTYAPDLWSSGVTSFLAGWAEPVGAARDTATGYPKRVKRTKDGMEMVLIPGGTFQMGAVPGDADADLAEKPRHSVTLSKAYYLDEHELNNEQFERFVTATGYRTTAETRGNGFSVDDAGESNVSVRASWRATLPNERRPADWKSHPVVLVSWDDARAFAAWSGAELPTEAQFERALRAGEDGRKYPWGDASRPTGRSENYEDASARRQFPSWTAAIDGYDDGFARTAPVKSFAANAFGLYDMNGNVREWCADFFGETAYSNSPTRDPAGPGSGSSRVLRGGSWANHTVYMRASYRAELEPSGASDLIGFRCARSVP